MQTIAKHLISPTSFGSCARSLRGLLLGPRLSGCGNGLVLISVPFVQIVQIVPNVLNGLNSLNVLNSNPPEVYFSGCTPPRGVSCERVYPRVF
jgi:hypothetical protein